MLPSAARDCGKRAIERALLASSTPSTTLLRSPFSSSTSSSSSPSPSPSPSPSSSSSSSSSVLRVVSFGHALVPYSEALALQESIAEARKVGALTQDVSLSLQHAPVYTLGKRARPATDLLPSAAAVAARASAEVSASPRGGQATWHGPGQAVVYPILLLKGNRIGVRRYMEELESSLVAVAAGLGVEGARAGSGAGSPGAWVDVPIEVEGAEDPLMDPARKKPLKIGAVGVRVSGGVATHGAALNVSPDLAAFGAIVPCGDEGAAPTSVAFELQRKRKRLRDLAPPHEDVSLDAAKVGLEVVGELARRLGYERTERVGVEELRAELSRLGFL